MLYIFLMDTGNMLTFDINLAMDSVSKLQTAIATVHKIAEDKQVLLISGGEHLDPSQRVCSYSSGTDTNPIFLFSKSAIESSVPPAISESIVSDTEMRYKVERALNMPPSYETVVTRAQLALQFHEVAREELKTCEQLVLDQHLQHQGWAAAVANLEDISLSFSNRTEIFKQSFKEFLNAKARYLEVLSSFHLTLDLLSRMPMLPCLALDGSDWKTESDDPKSLLNWIASQDSRNSLEPMAEACRKGIEQFDEHMMETLLNEVQGVVESVNNPNMKEVKGLEDRLSKLEQLMFSARKYLQEQGDMSQGFIQNQNRASNVRDNSIFPDLCASHKQQLKVMLQNHQSLILARGKCGKAKEELCYNLHQRLRWIMYVEKNLYDVDGKLVIHHEKLKRLKRRLEILQHVHNAPKIYSTIVTEIYRRRNFREKFGKWAAMLAEDSSHLYKEESARRAAVAEFVGHHFFKSLFPGIHDQPPPFATEPPEVFDSNLPQVTAEDIETLQKALPELEDYLRVPEPLVIANHFSSVTLRGTESIRLDQSTSDIEVINHPDDMSPKREVRSQLTKDVDGAKKDDEIHSDVEILDMESDTFGTPPDTRVPSRLGASKEPDMKKSTERPALVSSVILKSKSDTKVTEQGKDIVTSGQALSTSPCLSPHDETSDEFTTGVFYMDESMPSSMTESPPVKYRIAELQQMVHEKTAQLEASENTAHVYKDKLDKVEVKFKSLYTLAEKEILKIKCDILSTEKFLQKEKEEFSEYIDSITKSILSAMNKVEMEQVKVHEQELDQLRNEHERLLKDKEERCVEKSEMLKALHVDLEQYREQITKVNEELDEQKEKMELLVQELKEGFEAERDEIMKSLTLEHEVEVEKIRAEFEQEIGDRDKKIRNLDVVVGEKSSTLENITKELECLKKELMEKFQKEKDEIVKIMEKDHGEKMAAVVADVTERLEQTHKLEVETLKKEHKKILADACEELKESLKKEFETRCDDIRSDLEKEHNELVEKIHSDLESEKLKDLDELRTSLLNECEDKVESLKGEITVLQQEVKRLQEGTVSNEEVLKLKADAERDKECAVKEALDKLVIKHNTRMDTLIQEHKKDKRDSLNSMKTSMVADKQVAFNEALSKVVAEKDKVIDDLMQREDSLLALQEKNKEMIDMLMLEREESEKASVLGSQERQQVTPDRFGEHLAKAECDLEHLQISPGAMTISTMGQSYMGLSVVPIRESMSLTDTDNCMAVSRIEELETIIRDRDEEIGKLQTKMMELSMTQSTRFLMQHDKVSITTCHVGDLVLLCLDERHDHYVVFTVGTTLHFLHSDCLDTLNLKIVIGENRKSWVLAEVTEKEYCQAKKPQNRFKVPVGTKFYRVKAKPWDREAALKKDTASASVK